MSTTPVSPAERLRIALTITALKHKPPELSYESLGATAYVLELRRRYPSPATKTTTEECDAWRERALQLEAELHAARTAATTEAIGLLLRKPPSPSAETGATEPTPPASRGGRKKSKKPEKQSDARTQALETPPTATKKPQIRQGVSSGSEPPRSSLGMNRGIFSSLHGLDDIAARIATKSSSPLDAAQVAGATIRCVDALRALLAGVTSTASVPPVPEDATPQEAIDGIGRILQHILRVVLPVLQGAYIDSSTATRLQWCANPASDETVYPSQTIPAVDLVLARVIAGILFPAIRALAHCTLAKTQHMLSDPRPESPKKTDFADGAQLLGLISAILDALSDQRYIALHDLAALNAVRELTSLITDRSSRVTHARLTPAQRIHRIASKDALHFLCDAALLALRRSAAAAAPTPHGSREKVIRAELAEALGDLALTQSVRRGAGSGLDVVEEQRVMVVLERAWSVGLRVGHIGGNVDGENMDVSRDGEYEQDGDAAMMDVVHGPKEHQASAIFEPWTTFIRPQFP